MPAGAQVLSVQVTGRRQIFHTNYAGANAKLEIEIIPIEGPVRVWFLCDPTEQYEPREFYSIGEGIYFEPGADRYIGTVEMYVGQVFHIFERIEHVKGIDVAALDETAKEIERS